MQGSYDYFPQDRILFGERLAVALRREMAAGGHKRVFVMSAGTLSRETEVIAELKAELGEGFVGLFDEMPAHSPRGAVLAAIGRAREARPDLLLSIGGGSSIDGAKMVQVGLAENVRELSDFDALHLRRGEDGAVFNPGVKPGRVRSLAVPTTLSGAEFTHTAGSVDEARRKKDLYVDPALVPRAVILDPALTLHTPDWLWFSTAVRSIDHAVESIYSLTANPFTDATCLHGLKLMQEALRRSRQAPGDLAARLQAQMAVWLSTTGMARGQHGASHGISYSLAAVANVSHGHCSCVLLPATLRYNKAATAPRQALIAEALGQPGGDAADALLALLEELGQPRRLRDVGVSREQLPVIARTVIASGQARFNPRPVETEADVMEILETAF